MTTFDVGLSQIEKGWIVFKRVDLFYFYQSLIHRLRNLKGVANAATWRWNLISMISARRVITLDSCRESEQVAAAVAAAVVYIWLFALCLFLIVADVQITFIAVHNPQSKPRPWLLVVFFKYKSGSDSPL